jgi:hypothetical protein
VRRVWLQDDPTGVNNTAVFMELAPEESYYFRTDGRLHGMRL